MTSIGTPLSPSSTKALLLGSGELGKEVVIELQRFGVEVIAVDRYENAPAMQVAHRSHIISMLDEQVLRKIIEQEEPDFIIPEIEAIATESLVALESEGFNVVPSAKAVNLTMNREGIRRLVAEELGIKTSPYRFVETKEDFFEAIQAIGLPFIVKPIMSSSGKGQMMVEQLSKAEDAWEYAQSSGRVSGGWVIVEGLVEFDYEITLLTVRHKDGTSFCEPIGHKQIKGDYRESWQPQAMSPVASVEAKRIAKTVTEALGGYGIFGVELFIKGDEVYFNEVSPRPHDTGLVTLASQELSEFALHVRAILGLPIPTITQYGETASCALVVEGTSSQLKFYQIDKALEQPNTDLKLFGKPEVNGYRRMGVGLARGESIENARAKARQVIETITYKF